MLDWLRQHHTLMAWLGAISVVTFLAGVILLPMLLARMPADHYVREGPRPGSWRRTYRGLGLLVWAGKNLLGAFLVIAGLAMLVLPGQGVLTILLGLAMMDVPGKRRLELAILRRAPVRRAIAWLRKRAGRPPLELPAEDDQALSENPPSRAR